MSAWIGINKNKCLCHAFPDAFRIGQRCGGCGRVVWPMGTPPQSGPR